MEILIIFNDTITVEHILIIKLLLQIISRSNAKIKIAQRI